MIQKVSFRNFKAYRSLDLDLEPLTVIVGPNASGKTTLLQGLRIALGLAAGQGVRTIFPRIVARDALVSYGTSSSIEWSFSGEWDGSSGSVRLLSKAEEENVSMAGQWAGAEFEDTYPLGDGPVSLGAQLLFKHKHSSLRKALRSTSILRFEVQSLANASYSDAPVPEMDGSGNGLASVLAYLKLSQDEMFEEIEQALKQIVPSVRHIRIERAEVNQTTLRTIALDEQRHQVPEQRKLWGNKVILDMRGAKGIPADSAGEGTLMTLGLLTVLMGPKRPRLVLLDDIELGLHPVAQGKLIETLRKLQTRDPGLQIVATSHSPFILNYLKPEEVRMAFLAENGFARCEKLTAHPEFERWKDMMSPGEFWSTVGESWVEKVEAPKDHE